LVKRTDNVSVGMERVGISVHGRVVASANLRYCFIG